MRLFVAVPVDAATRREAGELLGKLQVSGADYKWVDSENLHVTLSFHGAVAPEKIPALKKAMAQAVAGRACFSIGLEGLGAFDSLERPRIVWVGVGQGRKELSELARALGLALEEAGLAAEPEKEKEFRAHLTLGRRRGPGNQEKLASLLRSTPATLGKSTVNRIVLYESRLYSSGARYAELAEARLV